MNFSSTKVNYADTGSFSRLVVDYLNAAPSLNNFYNFFPDIDGFKNAVEERKTFPVNRELLVNVLKEQYMGVDVSPSVQENIESLLLQNTFTVCTAHQPNIFTGHLYFIYKILHAVKLSAALKVAMPAYNFVPVYYMGSEDADIDELGEVNVNGTQYKWQTQQKGAVGRMKVDDALINIIDAMAGQLAVETNGEEIINSIREIYKKDTTIELATFHFVHQLFNKYGLIILLPDNRSLKNTFSDIIKRELTEQYAEKAVAETIDAFPAEYKVQAAGRNINLFYLTDNTRERIEMVNDKFVIANTKIVFTKEEIFEEIKNSPERFSPNVILRPVFQEMILPNVAFIGGGGELAYWLELKNVFQQSGAFFPVLVLRNSFTIINKKTAEKIAGLGFNDGDIFENEKTLIEKIVLKESSLKLDLEEEKEALKGLYEKVKSRASDIDSTLKCHVHALRTQALNRLEIVEKKMLKAEKKKFEAQQRQIKKIKSLINPGGNLQERVDNILPYIAVYGEDILDMVYSNSNAHEAAFTILKEQ